MSTQSSASETSMKVQCDNCGAKYSLAQKLLKKKVTKFRCKKCSHIIVVRRDIPEEEPDLAAISQPEADEKTMIGAAPPRPVEASTDVSQPAPHQEQKAADWQENNPDEDTIRGVVPPSSPSLDAAPAATSQESMSGSYAGASADTYAAPSVSTNDPTQWETEAAPEANWDAAAQEAWAQQAGEEDIFAGVSTTVQQAGEGDIFAGVQTTASDHKQFLQEQALDDEFDLAVQEQEAKETQIRRVPQTEQPAIKPNVVEQGVVPWKQPEEQSTALALLQEQNTKVFNIKALEVLRAEKKAAQSAEEEAAKQATGRYTALPQQKKSLEEISSESEPTRMAAPPPPSGAAAIEEPKEEVFKEEPEWYVLEGEEQKGPFTFSHMKISIRKGAWPGETMVWKETFSQWRKLEDVASFASSLSQSPHAKPKVSPPLQPPPSAPAFGAPAKPKPPAPLVAPPPTFGAPAATATPSSDANPAVTAAPFFGSSPSGEMAGPAVAEPAPSFGSGASSFGTGNVNTFGASTAFSGASDPFGSSSGSPFADDEKEGMSTTTKVLLFGGLFLILFSGAVFAGVYFLILPKLNKNNNNGNALVIVPNRRTPARRVVTAVRPNPVRRVQPVPIARPRLRPVTPQPRRVAPRPVPLARKAAPARRVARRRPPRRRRVRRRRVYRRRVARARYIPPRRRPRARSGGALPPPPPPPPGGGGALPPPPPPPPGGLPGRRPTARRAALNSSVLDKILGGGGSPAARRAAPRPRPVSNLPRSLTRSQVLGVIRRNAFKINNCQENYASSVKKIVVGWVIQRSGRASSVRVSPSTNSRFSGCVKKAVGRWRFPRFSGSPIPIRGVPFRF